MITHKRLYEIAYVLKALEIRATRQSIKRNRLLDLEKNLLNESKKEEKAWNKLVQNSGIEVPKSKPLKTKSIRYIPLAKEKQAWSEILNESIALLDEEGINLKNEQKKVDSGLDTIDIIASLSFGALGAALPSIGNERGFVNDVFNKIQKSADGNNLPSLIQKLFGGEKPAPFMDGGVSGQYHRFVHGHDLLWAIPQGIKNLGVFNGIKEVIQHLIRDSFGPTGIPLPGSTLIGEAIAKKMGSGKISDIINPRDLSRYAAIRMSDVAASGTVSLLLWLYHKIRKIDSSSIKSAKLSILSHGLCFSAIAIAALLPGLQNNVPYRSHLNYISLSAVAFNTYKLYRLTRNLHIKNQELFNRLESDIYQLELLPEKEIPIIIDNQINNIIQLSQLQNSLNIQ